MVYFSHVDGKTGAVREHPPAWQAPARRRCMDTITQVPTTDRFWSQVNIQPGDACWEWTGKLHRAGGYGRFSFNGERHFAHRFAGRSIPKGKFICHHCDNPCCVRPDHLFLGTPRENIEDSVKKGRRRYWSNITAEQVREIRRLHECGMRQSKIARQFGVSHTAVGRIVARQRRQDVV
jgi:hypothetical protein